ncbi:hypothetical protein [Actinomycetospora sp. CA-084318]|uniref:hypothetical protein n=1 Tax=Actinomycetospora sp. CA-084318 TaxID=3239892 RepID=UPI003D972C16
MSRPLAVWVAVVLIAATAVLRVVGLFVLGGFGLLPIMGLVALVVSIMVAGALFRGLRGTADIAIVVLVLAGVQAVLTATEPEPVVRTLGIVEAVLSVVTIVVLLLPPVRAWAGRRVVTPAGR